MFIGQNVKNILTLQQMLSAAIYIIIPWFQITVSYHLLDTPKI